MRLTYRVLIGIALIVTGSLGVLSAQFLEPPPQQRTAPVDSTGVIPAGVTDQKPLNELLQQATFDYSDDAALLRLKVAKLWVEAVSNRYFPIYILANPSALIPAAQDSVSFSAKELLNQFGGLLNIAFAKPWIPRGSIAGHVGPQGEARVGAKLVQFPTDKSGSVHGTGVGQLGLNGSWLFRLWGDKTDSHLESLLTRSVSWAFSL